MPCFSQGITKIAFATICEQKKTLLKKTYRNSMFMAFANLYKPGFVFWGSGINLPEL